MTDLGLKSLVCFEILQEKMDLFGLYLILATTVVVQGYRKFGLNCNDIDCISGQKCIVSRVPCESPDQQKGEQCGTYPECQSDQTASDFTIDTTQTTANTQNNIIIPSTSTNLNRNNGDNDFELLTGFANTDILATHAGQRQANVLVIVQDGSQQSQQPNPWLNRGQSPPCTVSPLYPYSCTYPGFPNSGAGLPSYPQQRSASVPQLVPPTPPCYYNCYPRVRSSAYGQYGYPLARSANPSSTNNYLIYLTVAG
ncbi:uncharacterized protein LOC6545357 isoform X1 [Drosophila erecta]|uniref:Uncharacterized protein, isoform A n=1 Tax=Drosophila erecta TaxID=7220 RepID=B3NCW2_DROER|nr:uncharacterized protein LOC6545357 isoform X1 [Drosophila erecta]EDV51618.2 uncharacterized protein Dere_GG15606, isoform A [Drosophila erecta]